MASTSVHHSDAYSSDDDASYDLIEGFRGTSSKSDTKQLGDVIASFQVSLEHTVSRIIEEKLKDFETRLAFNPSTTEQQEFSMSESVEVKDEVKEPEENKSDEASESVIVEKKGTESKWARRFMFAAVIFMLASFVVPCFRASKQTPASRTSEFAEQMKGSYCIKTAHDQYLRAWKGEYHRQPLHADMAPHCKQDETWNVEISEGKVVMWASFYGTHAVLEALPNGKVGLRIISIYKRVNEYSLWTPIQNSNGKWALKSALGTYLNFKKDGSIKLEKERNVDEEFIRA